VVIRAPQPWEYNTCQEIHLTSCTKWTPHNLHLLFGDAPHHIAATNTTPVHDELTRFAIHLVSTTITQDSTLAHLNTMMQRLDISVPLLCKRFGGVACNVVANTFKHTTQLACCTGNMPLH
jgi:hypothetical protein